MTSDPLVSALARRAATLRSYLELARPWQWSKNAFVLVGLLFGHAWHDSALARAALLATLAFCLASAAAYAWNDAADAAQDRAHPGKARRPVARGAISPTGARRFATGCATVALGCAAAAGPGVALCLAGYLALSLVYTGLLKRFALLDVFAIAAGFMLRLLAGTAGIGIEPSPYLVACALLLTLFLGFAKRRAELATLGVAGATHRRVLDAYRNGVLDAAVLVCAAGMLAVYTLYAVSEQTAARHGTRGFVLTVPWVLFGTFRYLYRAYLRGGGGDPAEELLRDPLLALAVAGWLATVLWLLAGSGA